MAGRTELLLARMRERRLPHQPAQRCSPTLPFFTQVQVHEQAVDCHNGLAHPQTGGAGERRKPGKRQRKAERCANSSIFSLPPFQIEYSKIREIRAAPRAFGAWGDVVFFLDDGSRLPLAGLERFDEIVAYIERCRERL